jgi:hypothetical protein
MPKIMMICTKSTIGQSEIVGRTREILGAPVPEIESTT